MRLFKMTLLILFFMNGILSYSQNTEGYHGRPESVIYKHGRIVLPNGMKLSPETFNMMFDVPDGYKMYRRTSFWHMVPVVVGVSAGLIQVFVIPPVNEIMKRRGNDEFDKKIAGPCFVGCSVVYFSCVVPETILRFRMKRWVNSYNTQGIIQTHAEMSVGPTPSGFGLCLNF